MTTKNKITTIRTKIATEYQTQNLIVTVYRKNLCSEPTLCYRVAPLRFSMATIKRKDAAKALREMRLARHENISLTI
jgi:hypothetical protein